MMDNLINEAPAGALSRPAPEYGVLDALTALARRKALMVLLPLSCALAGAALYAITPKTYRASTQLLPPQQAQTGAAAMLAQLGGAAAAVTGASTVKNPNDVYVAMLGSRRVMDRLLARFELLKVYDVTSPERARRALKGNTAIRVDKSGLITLDFDDRDPKRAAAVANGYVDELVALTKVLAVTEAGQRRLFFERQLGMAKDELASAEQALKAALDTNGVISVDSDSRALIETVGRLRAQISAREVQVGALEKFVTTANPEYRRAQEELNSLKSELARLQNGRPEAGAGADSTPAARQRGLENIKILRDVKYYQMLYELLAKQYEAARLDEAKDAAVIQVLDRAVEPEHKVAPKLLWMLVGGAALGLLAALAIALGTDARDRLLQSEQGRRKWTALRAAWRVKSA